HRPPRAIERSEQATVKDLMVEFTKAIQGLNQAQKSLPTDDLNYIMARLDHIEKRLDRIESKRWWKKLF
ncbi:MAG: hypothetical protein ABR542_09055, partial [Desulfonatronovibrio sp.]